MSGLGQRIKRRLDEIGMAEREASRRAGFGLSYVGDVIHGRSKEPSAERLITLARVLDVDLDYLIGHQSQTRAVSEERSFAPVFRQPSETIRMINLYASPSMAQGPWVELLAEAVDKVPVIPPLAHVPDAYAYSVSGTHMEPRYFVGEVVYLHPGLTPRVGDFVFAKNKDGRVGLCRVKDMDDESFTFSVLSGGEWRIPRADLVLVHRAVGSAG